MHRLKNTMESELELLQQIQRVPAPDHLYGKIQQRIALRGKSLFISKRWVRAAGIAAMLVIGAELYYVLHQMKQQQTQTVESLAYNPAYHFSYE